MLSQFCISILIAVAKLPSLKIVPIYIPIISISDTLTEWVLAVYIAKKKKKSCSLLILIFNFVECSRRSLTRISEDQAGRNHHCGFSDLWVGSITNSAT